MYFLCMYTPLLDPYLPFKIPHSTFPKHSTNLFIILFTFLFFKTNFLFFFKFLYLSLFNISSSLFFYPSIPISLPLLTILFLSFSYFLLFFFIFFCLFQFRVYTFTILHFCHPFYFKTSYNLISSSFLYSHLLNFSGLPSVFFSFFFLSYLSV